MKSQAKTNALRTMSTEAPTQAPSQAPTESATPRGGRMGLQEAGGGGNAAVVAQLRGQREALFDTVEAAPARALPFRQQMEAQFGPDVARVSARFGDEATTSALTSLSVRGAARGNVVAFASDTPTRADVSHEVAHVMEGVTEVHFQTCEASVAPGEARAEAAETDLAVTDAAALETELRDRAIAALPAVLSTLDVGLCERVHQAIHDAVHAALGATLQVARDNEVGGSTPLDGAVIVDSEAVLTDARTRYDAGPGRAAERMPLYLGEARGVCDDVLAGLTDAEVESALALYIERTARSVGAFTNIQTNSSITLATAHSSGVEDNATAADNVQSIVEGVLPELSDYGNAPGGEVDPSQVTLDAIGALSRAPYDFDFAISELTGGSHSRRSRHYRGVAIDVNRINGARVSARNPDFRAFMDACRELGATEVLGPGTADHDTHVHAAWP
jgi:hypothetical protein